MILRRKEHYFPYDIQILKSMWDELRLADVRSEMFAHGGLPKIAFFRRLAARMNRMPQFKNNPVPAGMLNLYAIITEVYRYLIDEYLELRHPALLSKRLKAAGLDFKTPPVINTVKKFAEFFPGTLIVDGIESPSKFVKNDDKNHSRKKDAIKELILLRIAEYNTAVDRFRPLLDTTELSKKSQYIKLIKILEREFKKSPVFNPFNLTLLDLLLEPVKASPSSLAGQIEYIKKNWGIVLPEELISELAVALDIVKEEEREWWGTPGPPVVLEFEKTGGKTALPDYDYPEYEHFSPDKDWMSNVVLMAKMIHVWLYQLSKKYGRSITRLDEIPDEELDLLSRWGFTGLWLIGVWERSPASKKIKHQSGNIDALASAYSLFDYVIAEDLGGEPAIASLRERAKRRGIRLASDMVPNHTGIYSKWILEHPDWFIQLDYAPYPAYSFTGENLSFSPDITLQLEDRYRTKTDAAVVFKYVDDRIGRTRYIYHGNDGTSTPWNDTAQLNYLLPEVREAVIQTILHVARNFPIIRFDAAMTLAKKHYERLWYPIPGHGGGIPSRAEHGMTREEFDDLFPMEFWREVVDRVAVEAPDTLLLAEAFWLMEGYFVRTLGMHRVYNSAFMNMLKLEENAKYRQTVKNVLEFNPEILKRFVNFMNNPDEDTAAAQFGKEGKYLGVSVMMVTMPGMPMFGHGQVEGFTEKYGMEYSRHYRDEEPDRHLMSTHETKIFPLMKKRYIFSGSDNFVFYDFFSGSNVNEDVFVYSNRFGNERGLVIYHNKFASTAGWLRTSVSFMVKQPDGTEYLAQKSLGEAMGFNPDGRYYYTFKDCSTGLEYIRSGKALYEKGLYLELHAYGYFAFVDFNEIYDDEFGNWGKLCYRLGERPVSSINEEFMQVKFQNAILPLNDILTTWPDSFTDYKKHSRAGEDDVVAKEAALVEQQKIFLSAVSAHFGGGKNIVPFAQDALSKLTCLAALLAKVDDNKKPEDVMAYLISNFGGGYSPALFLFLSAYISLLNAGSIADENDPQTAALSLIENFGLGRTVENAFEKILSGQVSSSMNPSAALLLVKIAIKYHPLFLSAGKGDYMPPLRLLLNDINAVNFLLVNEYDDRTWFNKERFEEMLYCFFCLTAIEYKSSKAITNLLKTASASNYCLDTFLSLLDQPRLR